jgi:hypothetical protein
VSADLPVDAPGPGSGSRSLLATVFLSPSERRLRAGWRLLLQVILQILLTGCLGALLLLGSGSAIAAPLSAPVLAIGQISELLAITASIVIARRFLDRRSFVGLGLQLGGLAVRDFLAGMAITFLMMGWIFTIEVVLGWLQISQFAWQIERPNVVLGGIGLFLAICVIVGWNEELMSRGYHLQTLASGVNVSFGWIASSLVFGALHFANPHSSWTAVIGIVFAGLFLGYGYLRTGQLWLSMGLHTGWNFFEGVVFGFPVSGMPFYQLIRTQAGGPQLWTGGAFGPEAGIIVLPAIAFGAVLVYLYSRGRARA